MCRSYREMLGHDGNINSPAASSINAFQTYFPVSFVLMISFQSQSEIDRAEWPSAPAMLTKLLLLCSLPIWFLHLWFSIPLTGLQLPLTCKLALHETRLKRMPVLAPVSIVHQTVMRTCCFGLCETKTSHKQTRDGPPETIWVLLFIWTHWE